MRSSALVRTLQRFVDKACDPSEDAQRQAAKILADVKKQISAGEHAALLRAWSPQIPRAARADLQAIVDSVQRDMVNQEGQ